MADALREWLLPDVCGWLAEAFVPWLNEDLSALNVRSLLK